MHFLDFSNTLLGGAYKSPPLEQVFVAGWEFSAGLPPILQPMVDLTAHVKSAPELVHVHGPVQGLFGVLARLLFGFPDVEIPGEGDGRHRYIVPRLPGRCDKTVAKVQGIVGVQDHAQHQRMAGGDHVIQGFRSPGGRNVNRRMWFLQGQGHQVRLFNLKMVPVEREPGCRPQPLDDADSFLEPLLAFSAVDAITPVFVPRRAASEPGVKPAVADNIQGSRLFSQPYRVMQSRHQYRGPQPNCLGLSSHMGGKQQGRRAKAVPGEVVLRQPGPNETQLLAGSDLFGGLFQHLFGIDPFRPGDMGKEPELHYTTPPRLGGLIPTGNRKKPKLKLRALFHITPHPATAGVTGTVPF